MGNNEILEMYKHSIIQNVEHDEMKQDQLEGAMREQYNERAKQLDENESVLKEEYDKTHLEEITGLTSDGYRHQVIKEYTHDKLADKQTEVDQINDYWDKSTEDTVVEENQNAMECEQNDYWEANNSSESIVYEYENINDNSNEASY